MKHKTLGILIVCTIVVTAMLFTSCAESQVIEVPVTREVTREVEVVVTPTIVPTPHPCGNYGRWVPNGYILEIAREIDYLGNIEFTGETVTASHEEYCLTETYYKEDGKHIRVVLPPGGTLDPQRAILMP